MTDEMITLQLEGRTVRLTPDERDEWARRAVKVFQSMEYSLSAFARVLTGDNRVRLELTTGRPSTNGRTIYYRPPLYLGDPSPHKSSQCDRRDAHGHLICAACMVRESVVQIITHEIAHIVGGSFSDATDYEKRSAIRKAVNTAVEPAAVRALHNGLARVQYNTDVQQMLKQLSPFLLSILLALEDARIDLKMFRARLGTEKMFRSMTKRVFERGYPDLDGSVTLWKEKPLNAQIMIGCFCVAEGYDYTGWLHPDVERDLKDPVLGDILARVDRSGGVMDIAGLSIETLVRLWQMGYCNPPSDMPPPEPPEPEPEPPAPEPEPEEQHEDEPDSPEGEGETGESGQSGESSEGDPSPGADSSGADGSPEESQDSPESDSGDGGDASGSSSDVGPSEQGDGQPGAGSERSESESVPDGSGDEPGSERDGSQDSDPGSGGDADPEDRGQAESDQEASGATGEPGEQSDPGTDASGDKSSDGGTSPMDAGEGGREGSPGEDHHGGDESEDSSPAGSDNESDLEDDQPEEAGDSGGSADGAGPEAGDPSARESDSNREDSQPGESTDGDPGESGDEGASGDPEPSDSTGGAPEDGAGPADSQAGGQDASASESADPSEESAHSEPATGHEGSGGAAQSVPTADAPNVPQVGDEQDGGLEDGPGPDPEPVPDHGSAEDVVELIQDFTGHNHDDDEELHLGMPSSDEDAVNAAMDKAITQNKHFDMPTGKVVDVQTYTWPEDDGACYAWLSNYEPSNLTLRTGDSEYKWDLLRTPETILQPAQFDMRRVFSDNRRGRREPNLRTGHVNGRVLGRRAWSGDDRLFKKTTRPKSKSYAVIIGLDISGSTDGAELVVEKQAVFAQAELLHRMGIEFEVWAHSARKAPEKCWGLQMYRIKAFNQPWSEKVQEGVAWLHSSHYNLDGHTVEFYRKRFAASSATTKILLYFTDGAMPAANKEDEVNVLRQEVKNYQRLGITMLGVGIGTDSPKQWGMDTIRINNKGDIGLVVKHLEGILTMKGR